MKAHLGSLIDRVEVDDRDIRICGRKDVLEECVIGGAKPTGAVRSSVRDWLPFLNTYRTMCLAPKPEFRRVLEEIRQFQLTA